MPRINESGTQGIIAATRGESGGFCEVRGASFQAGMERTSLKPD
jgi:hypothetical protein